MKHTEGRFTGRKGLSLYYQCWLPATDPKAILLVVHGWAEHSGRYTNLVNYFVPKGYVICALDHRGHGKSEGRRGYVERFSDYLDDLKTFFDIVRSEHGDTKIFLVGHSMGAIIATAYTVTVSHQQELAGLIVSGVGVKPGSSLSSALIPLARILSLLLPRLGIMVLDASAISQDKAVVDAYVNDPLVYRGKITCRFGAEMLATLRKLPSEMPEINLPILIMHGTADRLCDPEGSRILYERANSRDKTLKLYEGFYHEIFNEPGHKQVLADMEAWLAARI
ncbi:MAG: lysophospholipase [Dehalococcoidia bacterium]|nr:lysophospholipase [Dehalococcoidia bacterium]